VLSRACRFHRIHALQHRLEQSSHLGGIAGDLDAAGLHHLELLLRSALASRDDGAGRGSEADAFENKVQPVSGALYGKAGRFEISPSVARSLDDAFFTKVLLGGRIAYHPREWASVGLHGAFGFSSATGSTEVCPPNQGCHSASASELARVPGEIKLVTGLELGFSPVYGKLNVLAEKVAHIDLSLLAGADAIFYRQVLPPPTPGVTDPSPGTTVSIGGHVGLGTRVFVADWGAVRLEIKDYLYRVNTNGSRKLEQQLVAELGFSFFLGRRSP
jgi:outer membrane beta-barrel protein